MSETYRTWAHLAAAAMAEPVIQQVGDFQEFDEATLRAAVEVRLRQLLRDLRPAEER